MIVNCCYIYHQEHAHCTHKVSNLSISFVVSETIACDPVNRQAAAATSELIYRQSDNHAFHYLHLHDGDPVGDYCLC